MSARIIQLSDYRQSGFTCQPIGVTFPKIFRHTGLYFAEAGEAPDKHVGYVLNGGMGLELDVPAWTPIDRLDPAIDSGWLFLRHHPNLDRAYGYIDASCDVLDDPTLEPMLWQTPKGIFTLVRCNAKPGRPDHLLIYTASIPHPTYDEQVWTKVIGPDGTEVDENILSATRSAFE